LYAVVDLETTGTKSTWHDRVVEIAVVRGSITSTDEVVRRMAYGTALLVLPAQPERL